MDNNWIKISDREPEFPAWVTQAGDPLNPRLAYHSADCMNCTHWMPANIPAPPPRELTQREKDHQAFRDTFRKEGVWLLIDIWDAALAWEREQCEQALMEVVRNSTSLIKTIGLADIRDFFRSRREGGAK